MFILLKSNSTHLPASDHRCWVVNVNTKMKHIQQWAKLCLLKSGFELLPKSCLSGALHLILSISLFLHFSLTPFLTIHPCLFPCLSVTHCVSVLHFLPFDCFFYLFPFPLLPSFPPTSPSHPFLSAFLFLFYLYVWSLLPCLCLSLYLNVCLCFLYLCLLLFFPSRIHRSSLGTILLLERSSGLLNQAILLKKFLIIIISRRQLIKQQMNI